MQAKNSLPSIGNGNTIIYGCIVGSHAYGTNVEGSDTDRKWIYIQSAGDFFLNGYKPQIEISKDETAYELSRFLELLSKANPSILELLFAPQECVLYKHPVMDRLLYMKTQFLTKQCRHSFGGMAVSQIEKARGLDKMMNWEKESTVRKTVLDFCYFINKEIDPTNGKKFQSSPLLRMFPEKELAKMGLSAVPHVNETYNLFWDARYRTFNGVVNDPETSNDVALSDIPKDAHCLGLVYFNKNAYQVHCKRYAQYQEWLKERNTQRYVDAGTHGQKIDGKNLLHCVRVLDMAEEIVKTRNLTMRRPNASYLIEIRKGQHDLESILANAETKLYEIDQMYKTSALPDKFTLHTTVKMIHYSMRKNIEEENKARHQRQSNY